METGDTWAKQLQLFVNAKTALRLLQYTYFANIGVTYLERKSEQMAIIVLLYCQLPVGFSEHGYSPLQPELVVLNRRP